ncbi:TPA: hypothetical protein ND482_004083 [Citrobacter farmeri]|nr:hypothetical protein [Citrobacter farmeri]
MTFIAAIPLATIIREYESATLRLTLPVPTDDDDYRRSVVMARAANLTIPEKS